MDLGAYRNYLIRRDIKASTLDHHLKRVCYLARQLEVLNFDNFDKFIYELKSKGRLNSYLNGLIFPARVYGQYIGDERLANYKPFKQNKSKKAIFSLDELKSFLELPPPNLRFPKSVKRFNQWTMFFSIMAYCGCRAGEVRTLHYPRDVDFGRNVLIFRDTKNRDTREVKIANTLLEPLKAYCQNLQGEIMFKGVIGDYVDKGSWGVEFHRRLTRLNIKREGLCVHSIRHSFLTKMLQTEGINIYDVAEIVGHRDIKTTQIYYHIDSERLQKVVNKNPLNTTNLDKGQQLEFIYEELKKFQTFKNLAVELKKDERSIYFKITL